MKDLINQLPDPRRYSDDNELAKAMSLWKNHLKQWIESRGEKPFWTKSRVNLSNHWWLVTKNITDPNPWRITFFNKYPDELAPWTHKSYATFLEAARKAIMLGDFTEEKP